MERARPTHYVSRAQEVTMPVDSVPTPSAPAAAGPYSPAVRAGDWLVLAGQVGLDPATGTIVSGGVDAQARQVLANIAAVLRDCGAGLTDVAKTTVFVTDIAQFATVNNVYAEAFGDHRPARSTVQVAALPGGADVEIEAWAYLPR
jgi:2-iminobutanoate/2-iminopropanoate deaminase